MQTFLTWLKIIFSLCWVVFVLASFFHHFPFVHLGEILLNGMMLVILLLFLTAVGRRIFRWQQVGFDSLPEEISFSCGLGSCLSMALIFAGATLGLLYEPLILAGVGVIFIIVYQDARALCRHGWHSLRHAELRTLPTGDLALLALIGVAGSISFLAAATPPFFYDALVYHLAAPHKYLLQHGFHYLPHQHFSNFPANLGMLFILAMSFSKGMLVQLLSWAYTPLTALAVYAFTAARWGRRMALTAAATVFLIPGVLIMSTLASVEGSLMFYAFLSLAALLTWFRKRARCWFVCSAMFCSVGMGTKYTEIATTFLSLQLVLFLESYLRQKNGLWPSFSRCCLYGLIALAGLSPWLIKNIVYTGNPVYPFFHSLFSPNVPQHTNYTQLMQSVGNLTQPFLRQVVSDQPPGWSEWLAFLRVLGMTPWKFTMEVSGAAGKTGVLFLLCLPGLLFLRKIDPTIKYVLLAGACAFGSWLLLVPWIQRYIFPIFPALSIGVAYVIWHLPLAPLKRKWLVSGFGGVLLYQLTMFVGEEMTVLQPFTYLFGNASTTEFLSGRGVNYYAALQYLNTETPPDAKVLFVGESRGYYCERDYLLYTVIEGIDEREIPLRQFILAAPDIEALLHTLHQNGLTHILVNFAEMERLTKAYLHRDSYFGFQTAKDRDLLRRLFTPPYTRLLVAQNQVKLYEIAPFSEP